MCELSIQWFFWAFMREVILSVKGMCTYEAKKKLNISIAETVQ